MEETVYDILLEDILLSIDPCHLSVGKFTIALMIIFAPVI